MSGAFIIQNGDTGLCEVYPTMTLREAFEQAYHYICDDGDDFDGDLTDEDIQDLIADFNASNLEGVAVSVGTIFNSTV